MKIYKLDPEPKRYKGAPVLLPLSREQQFRQYVAKRKFEIALGEYQKRQRFYRNQAIWNDWGIFIIGGIQAALVGLLMLAQHLGVPGF
jgi:hypothetical protein